jgi:uncharacterized membrane protein YuzA (DUF378 family)
MAQSESHPGAQRRPEPASALNALDWIALVLLVIGGLNWGLIGAFGVDLVATLLGTGSLLARLVYLLVGLSALYGLVLMVRLGRAPGR